MKHNIIFVCAIAISFLVWAACGEGTDVVPSGTYKGTVDKVEASKSVIYVKTDDGKRLELYFTETTKLMQDGAEGQFGNVAKGQKVEVEVEKVGQRLDPLMVTILE
jgi:hypothetical protein